jgi:hypothetical protein
VRIAITVAWAFALLVIPTSVVRAGSDNTLLIAPQTPATRHGRPVGDGNTPPQIQVRVYNAGVVPAAVQAAAMRAAAMTLAAAGVGTSWQTCGEAPDSASSTHCETPLGLSELSVRFVNLPGTASAHGELPLGYSLVDTNTGAGKLATIYVDRVHWLAMEAGADMPTLVGLALAHEIGHLLLGTNAHARAGLMRAIWSRTELQRGQAADWRFGRSEAARMRASVMHLDGLRSAQLDLHAIGCSAPDGAANAATGTPTCAGNALASLRGVAAGIDR